jgi:hypothetical protein
VPSAATTISLRISARAPRSAWVTSEPSGSRRSSVASGPETSSIRPSGNQSIDSGTVLAGSCATTSDWPSASTASTSPTPQFANQKRSSCQRADSPNARPVSRTSGLTTGDLRGRWRLLLGPPARPELIGGNALGRTEQIHYGRPVPG